MSSDLSARLDRFLGRLEQWLPPELTEADWNEAVAFRWRKRQSLFGNIGYLAPIRQLPPIHLSDLHNIERQKDAIVANTRQFVRKLPANNVLLTGARGTGKSSLIKACLNEFVKDGLRLVEVDKDDLADLGDIVERLSARPERFAIFCDDLSFEEGESGYKALKSARDGSVPVFLRFLNLSMVLFACSRMVGSNDKTVPMVFGSRPMMRWRSLPKRVPAALRSDMAAFEVVGMPARLAGMPCAGA